MVLTQPSASALLSPASNARHRKPQSWLAASLVHAALAGQCCSEALQMTAAWT